MYILFTTFSKLAASPIRKNVADFCGKKPLSTQDWKLENWQLSLKITYNSFIIVNRRAHFYLFISVFQEVFLLSLENFNQQDPPLKLSVWGILCNNYTITLWIDSCFYTSNTNEHFILQSSQLEFYLIIFLKANSQPVRHFRGVWDVMVVWYLHKVHRIIRSFRYSSAIIVKFMHKLNKMKLV